MLAVKSGKERSEKMLLGAVKTGKRKYHTQRYVAFKRSLKALDFWYTGSSVEKGRLLPNTPRYDKA